MIVFDNVSFGYDYGNSVVKDFSMTVSDGARLCLSAPSGDGKTTLLRLLLGLERPRRGKITISEGTRFSAVFQENRLLWWKTLLENAALFSDAETARRTLCALGLGAVLDAHPAELSGGMKRRAALARALAYPFDVLVLDEALTGLDEKTKAHCLAFIDETVGRRTLVMASHDAGEASALHAKTVALE